MSFDQFNQDQVLNLDYTDNNGQRLVGMSVNDAIDLDILDLVTEQESIMKMRRYGSTRRSVEALERAAQRRTDWTRSGCSSGRIDRSPPS